MFLAIMIAGCGRVAFEPVAGDAPADLDTPPSGACVQPHAFCDDFDRPGGVRGPWQDVAMAAGTVVFDGIATSPPQSLRIDLPTPQPATNLAASLATPIPAGTAGVRLSFDLALSQADTNGEVDLVRLDWQTVPAGCTGFGLYFVRSTAGTLALQETYVGCGGVTYRDLPNVDHAFHHYELAVDYATDRFVVSRDGVEVLAKTALHELPVGAHRLTLGAASVITTLATPWQLRYDDLVVDLE